MDNEEQRKKTNRAIAVSSILHALLFLSFTVGSYFAPQPLQILPSVQIDMVALPTQVKNNEAPPPDVSLPVKPNAPDPVAPPEPKEPEPEAVAVKPEPAPAPKLPKPEPKEDFALEKKKEADAKKRADAAMKKMREQLKKERLAEEERKRELQEKRKEDLKKFEQTYRKAISGNQKNEGTSLTGQMQAVANAYAGALTDKIRSNWALPSFLQNQNLHASMVVHLDARGNVIKMVFKRVSGNTLFDNQVEAAIRRSTPFYPPPAELASVLRNSGIEVGFPL